MIDLDEIKTIMTARAEVTKILGGMFAEAPKFADVYALCRAISGALDAVEIVDEKDELLDGYNDLQDWYSKASGLAPAIIDIKLIEEFDGLFRKATAMSVDFPPEGAIADTYKAWSYTPIETLAPSNLAQMLLFISYMAENCATENDIERIKKSARVQVTFVENHIMPLISDFCAILYERAISHGIYRYLAVILHGYMNYDAATVKYF